MYDVGPRKNQENAAPGMILVKEINVLGKKTKKMKGKRLFQEISNSGNVKSEIFFRIIYLSREHKNREIILICKQ